MAAKNFTTLAIFVCLCTGTALGQWSTSESLSRHNNGAVVTWDGVLYYVGGDGLSSTIRAVDGYVASTDSWFQFQMPIPRRKHAATVLNGELFIAGGVEGSAQPKLDRVDIYDLETAFWQQETMPIPAMIQSAAAIGDKVFFAGGLGDQGHLRVIQVFDVTTNLWSIQDLDSPGRSYIASASDQRWVCFVGGSGLLGVGGEFLNIYDSLTDSWQRKIMPHSHNAPSAEIVDGKLYIAGGIWPDDGGIVDVLDLASDEWSVLALPTPRFFMASFSVGGYIVFGAGTDWTGFVHTDAVDVFNTRTGEWTSTTLAVLAGQRLGVASESAGIGGIFCGQDPTNAANLKDVDFFRARDDLGTRYCSAAVANTTGAVARMGAMGLATASENFFTLYAEELPTGSFGFGMFLISDQQQSMPLFGGSVGTLCLQGPTRILPSLQVVTPAGTMGTTLDLAALPAPLGPQVLAGDTFYFQAWYRDWSSANGAISNFSDAIGVSFN